MVAGALLLGLGLSLSSAPGETIVAATFDPHAYFNTLVARPEHWKSYSLRDQEQLLRYRISSSLPADVNYVYGSDPDPRRQDAAKVVIPADQVSLRNQVRLPMDTEPGRSYLVTWDYWFGAEWAYSNTQIGNCKNFQFGGPSDGWWLQPNAHWQAAAPGTLGLFDVRARLQDTVAPPIKRYIYPQRWTRLWVLFEQPGDGYMRVSIWHADEVQGPATVYDRLQVVDPSVPPTIGKFWLEYNTSAHTWEIPVGRGPLVSYVRNVVMLRDIGYETVLTLLQGPSDTSPTLSFPTAPKNLRVIGG